MDLYVRTPTGRYQPAPVEAIGAAHARVVASMYTKRALIGGSADAVPLAHAHLSHLTEEAFLAIYLDARHRVIDSVVEFRGTIDGASVHPRVLVRHCIERNAAAIIVAHNHPSGARDPSSADRALTRRLKDAVELIDVRLLDHFIIAGDQSFSFANAGLI